MEMEKVLPTRGQLERQISQTIQSLYRSRFGHLPGKISCHLFDKNIAIIAEKTITNVEKILLDNFKLDLALSVRAALNKTFSIELEREIADILQVEVAEIISNSTLDTGNLGIIVFLNRVPQMRIAAKECRKYKKISVSTVKENIHQYSG